MSKYFTTEAMEITFKNVQKKDAKGKDSLQYLPVGLFGSTVAISGLSIAWKQAVLLFGLPEVVANLICILAWAMFILLASLYLLKIIRYPTTVKEELTHPVKANYLGTFFISVVLLSYLTVPFSMVLARIIWITGTLGGLVYMYVLTARLFDRQLSLLDAVPPTLIPGLTLLNAVVAGAKMEFGSLMEEVNLILFSVGIVYVFVFFVIVTYRLVHREAIIPFLVPTLLLMSAPFEVSFSAYMSQVKQIDIFASVLFFFGLFIFIVLFFKVFKKGLPFMISWWSACFSIGALTNAALRYGNRSHSILVKDIAGIMLIAASILMSITFILTIRLQLSGRLLKP